jgi:hypothetical protein
VLISIKLAEKETGQVIATPLFYACSGAWSGAWGSGENHMVARISQCMSDYIVGNYTAAVGGVSGADAPRR